MSLPSSTALDYPAERGRGGGRRGKGERVGRERGGEGEREGRESDDDLICLTFHFKY